MREALKQAKKAAKIGDTPIGCVIVYDGAIIARGYNRRNKDKNTLAHAEITAIRRATKVIGDWRLEGCTIYVTLEPCSMCAGAMVLARVSRLVIGTMDPKAGACGSVRNIAADDRLNHRIEITVGVLEEVCSSQLRDFFREKRRQKRVERPDENQ